MSALSLNKMCLNNFVHLTAIKNGRNTDESSPRWKKTLQAIDKDNDGELDLEEFMEAYARWKLLLFQELNVNC